MRVAAFTGGHTISSARFRVRQYIPRLREHGIEADEFIARFGSWPPLSKVARPLWLPVTIVQRVPAVVRSHGYDLTLLQREMVSTLVTFEPFTKAPRVLDLDDAVWLNGSGKHVERLAVMCGGVICGNKYIADYVRPINANVCVLPTGVDTARFVPATRGDRKIIGWSGLSIGLKWVYAIEPAIAAILQRHNDVVLRIVSEKPPHFSVLPRDRVEYVPWSEETEVRAIQEMAVGLMPLEDSPFTRGKCSYKMLLYMACGIPVVVSPVGMNAEVLALGHIGLSATSCAEWVDAMDYLLTNDDDAATIGRAGRSVVELEFSLDVLTPKLACFLHSVLSRSLAQRAPAVANRA